MFTQIKTRDLNTPLLQRIEQQLTENKDKEKSQSNVQLFSTCHAVKDGPNKSEEIELPVMPESCSLGVDKYDLPSTSNLSEDHDNKIESSNLNDSGKENTSQEIVSQENIFSDTREAVTLNTLLTDEQSESTIPVQLHSNVSSNKIISSDVKATVVSLNKSKKGNKQNKIKHGNKSNSVHTFKSQSEYVKSNAGSSVCKNNNIVSVTGRTKIRKVSNINRNRLYNTTCLVISHGTNKEISFSKNKSGTVSSKGSVTSDISKKPQSNFNVSQDMFDEFKVQFEDDESPLTQVSEGTKQKKNKSRRKSRRSMDFTPNKPVLLSEEDRESTSSTPITTPTACITFEKENTSDCDKQDSFNLERNTQIKSKKNSRKRRSADVFVINTETNSSPDIELEGLEEMQTLPGTRRSRRLRRQSIEMFRTRSFQKIQTKSSSDDLDFSESSLLESLYTAENNVIKPTNSTQGETVELSQLWTEVKRSRSSSLTDKDISVLTKIESNADNKADDFSNNVVLEINLPENTQIESKAKASKRTRKSKERSSGCSAIAVPKQINRKRRKSEESPSVHDIYLNRLWRSQMPVAEKPWETIYESPHKNKSGKEEYVGVKKFKRLLCYENFYTQAKLKKRRQKASKMGYKASTKKKRELAEQKVFEKLTLLEDELELMEQTVKSGTTESVSTNSCLPGEAASNVNVNCNYINETPPCSTSKKPSIKSQEIIEDAFFTPMKSADICFTGEQVMTDNVCTNTVTPENVEDIFQTPQKTPPCKINIMYNETHKMTAIEEF